MSMEMIALGICTQMCTILNWIFEKQDTKIELDTSGSGLGLITGFREHGKELSGSMKAGNRL